MADTISVGHLMFDPEQHGLFHEKYYFRVVGLHVVTGARRNAHVHS
jgi:hypothetical protein